MDPEPHKPSLEGELELERLRQENAVLHGTIERLRKELEQLAHTQRRLIAAHAQLEDTFRRLMGKEPYKGGKQGR